MANDILNIIVKLGGQVEELQSILKQQKINFNVNVKSQLDGPLNELLKKQKSIKLVVDSGSAIKEATKLVEVLKQAQTLSVMQVRVGSTPGVTLNEARKNELVQRGFTGNFVGMSNADLEKKVNQARQDAAIEEFKVYQNRARKIQQLYNSSPEGQLSNFRSGFEKTNNIEQANLQFRRSSLFTNANRAREEAAFRNNVLPSQITANRSINDPRRFLNEQSIRELSFAALFGRGNLGKAGGIAGGLIGTAIGGPAGTFFGTAAGQVATDALAENFSKLKEAMDQASEAGIQFQRSVVAISAVLQSTSDIYVGGNKLDDLDQIKAQQQRAEGLQIAARKYLVPIGISGQNEAAYAQAIATGIIGRKGINLSSDQFGKFAGALGSAQVALRPDLSNNPTRLLKDLEDITAGSPAASRTSLGIALGGLTKEIANAKTGADIDRLTERLNKFRQAIEGSDKASVQLLRLSGAFDQLNTVFGDSREQSKTTGYKALADTLGSDKVQDGLKVLGKAIGEFENLFLLGGAGAITVATAALSGFYEQIREFSAKLGIKLDPLHAPETDNVTGEAVQNVRTQLDKIYESIGLDISSFDKEDQKSPFRRESKLFQAKDKAKYESDNAGGLTRTPEFNKDVFDITRAEFNNIDDLFKIRSQTRNEETLPGRKDTREFFLGKIEDQKVNLAEQADYLADEFKFAFGDQNERALEEQLGGEKITDLDEGRLTGLGTFIEKVLGKEGVEDLPAVLNIIDQLKDLNQKKGILSVESEKAYSGGLQNTQFELEETKKLGDAQKRLSEISKDQADKFRDLTLTVAQAKESLASFNLRIESTLASKEEQAINLQAEITALGGPDSQYSITDPDNVRQAKLASLTSRLSLLSQESGGGNTPYEPRLGLLPGSGLGNDSTLGLGFQQEFNGLQNTIKDSDRELKDLNRQFKDLSSTLANLIKIIKYNLGIKTSEGAGSVAGGSAPGSVPSESPDGENPPGSPTNPSQPETTKESDPGSPIPKKPWEPWKKPTKEPYKLPSEKPSEESPKKPEPTLDSPEIPRLPKIEKPWLTSLPPTEDNISDLEKRALGTERPEFEPGDRIENLERKLFGNVSSGGDMSFRMTKLKDAVDGISQEGVAKNEIKLSSGAVLPALERPPFVPPEGAPTPPPGTVGLGGNEQKIPGYKDRSRVAKFIKSPSPNVLQAQKGIMDASNKVTLSGGIKSESFLNSVEGVSQRYGEKRVRDYISKYATQEQKNEINLTGRISEDLISGIAGHEVQRTTEASLHETTKTNPVGNLKFTLPDTEFPDRLSTFAPLPLYDGAEKTNGITPKDSLMAPAGLSHLTISSSLSNTDYNQEGTSPAANPNPRLGDPSFMGALRDKYYGAIKDTDEEGFNKFIMGVKDQTVRDIFYKWRYPPGNKDPNILDKYETSSTIRSNIYEPMEVPSGSDLAEEAAEALRLPQPETTEVLMPETAKLDGSLSTSAFGESKILEGRASGGPVKPGQPYKVGEQGEELFFPSVPGVILNNSMTRTLADATKSASEKARTDAAVVYGGILGSPSKNFTGKMSPMRPNLPVTDTDDVFSGVDDNIWRNVNKNMQMNAQQRQQNAEEAGINGFRAQAYYTKNGAGGGTNSTESILKNLPQQIGLNMRVALENSFSGS